MVKTLILNYHGLQDEEKNYHPDPVYSIDVEQFEWHLQIIKENNISVVSLDDFVKNKNNISEYSIIITFDDGHQSDYDLAFPLLKKYGLTATFYVSMMNIQNEKRWKEYKEMAVAGMTIGSHSVSHIPLDLKDKNLIYSELADSKQILEENLNQEIKHFSFPFGRFNKLSLELAKEIGYQSSASTEFGFCDKNTDLFQLKRLTIRSDTNINTFKKIINQNKFEILKISSFYKTKNLIKKLIK